MKQIILIGLVLLVGCGNEPECDFNTRTIYECQGFESVNKSFEMSLWQDFKTSHRMPSELTNYDWCMKILDCEVSICEYEECE